ncbi:MAG TPA: HYR domain-containing protein [Thermoanaerobaculia bacterium]|nr:HYR domain-containing protein [Thermoanaerobaculia bacterium]
MYRPRAVLLLLAMSFATSAFALALPSDMTVEATSPAGAVVHFDASGNGHDDENGRPTTAVSCTPASGLQFALGSTTVNCTSGNESGSFTVTVSDTTAPALALPNDISVAGSSSGAAVTYQTAAHDAVDGNVPVSCSPASGSVFPQGTTTVTCSASDSKQNTSTGTFTVTVTQNPNPPSPPNLPGDITREATGPDGAVVTYSASGTGPDDENGRPSTSANCSPASGAKFGLGTTNVQCEGGSFKVHVVDTTAPALSLPRDFTVPGNNSGATVTYNASASDIVDGSVNVSCSPASGTTFPSGTTTVLCSATDAHQNEATGSFIVDVTTQPPPPPADNPPDLTREATGPNGAVVHFSVNGGTGDDDNGRPTNSADCSPASGHTFPLGETTVQCGNAGSFKVTVVDTTAPALLLPAEIVSSDPVVSYTASAQDLVDGSVAITCNPPSGSTFAVGTTVVTCSASDTRGNGSNGSFNVTVNPPNTDSEAPTIVSITASPDSLKPPNGRMVDVTLTVDVIDNIDTMPYVNVFAVTANETITSGDFERTGPLTLKLRAERDPRGEGRVYTIHVEAIDDAGNRSTSTVTVTVPHDQGGATSSPVTAEPTKRRRSARG